MEDNTKVLRCNNIEIHEDEGEGNILMFFRGNSIFIKCSNHHCKRWNQIKIDIPGIKLDLTNAAFVQKLMPKNYYFNAKKAAIIIEDNK